MTLKPMLAGKLDGIEAVRYPVHCTPKIDGIRCLISEAGPVSRKLKAIPNDHIREALWTLPQGLDGEIWIPGAKTFGDVTTAVMRQSGKPNFVFYVFDSYTARGGYADRCAYLRTLALPEWAQVLDVTVCEDAEALASYEAACVEAGFEGVMLRTPNGPYKQGRSTVNEGWLLKLKRFEDDEAEIVGVQELLHNENVQMADALGHSKRSSHAAGKRAGGKLGALVVRRASDGLEFNVGTGFTDVQRDALWEARGDLPGLTIKYRHQGSGAKDAPRFPVFLGFRHPND